MTSTLCEMRTGLTIDQGGKQTTLPVDTVVICAGQESLTELEKPLAMHRQPHHSKKLFLIGGAQEAGELDAKRAIDQVCVQLIYPWSTITHCSSCFVSCRSGYTTGCRD